MQSTPLGRAPETLNLSGDGLGYQFTQKLAKLYPIGGKGDLGLGFEVGRGRNAKGEGKTRDLGMRDAKDLDGQASKQRNGREDSLFAKEVGIEQFSVFRFISPRMKFA
jgi:hypothetical protein